MLIEEVLKQKGIYVSTTSGISMYPMLRHRRDTIVVKPVTKKLKRYDVPLYRRGDDYVLHRIIGEDSNGYIICGDNCVQKEYAIKESQIIGVLSGFYRGNKLVNMDGLGYKIYSRIWVFIYPARMFLKKVRAIGGIIKRRVRKV